MLSSDSVIEAGVQAVRERGLAELSIRSLAERLGVTPMALYHHVANAEALHEQVIDAVLARLPALAAEGGWTERARGWALGAREALAGHPGVARHVLTHWFGIPRALDHVEALLSAAETRGLHGLPAVAAVNAVFTFVLMRVEAEEAIRAAGVVRRKLATDRGGVRWPRLQANAREYEVARFDLHFHFGLDSLLAGIDRSSHADP